jgi:hypothetical protein
VKGNSIGMAERSSVPLKEQFFGLLALGDATIHHCVAIHHSAANTTDFSCLGLLLVYRGGRTKDDPVLRDAYTTAVIAFSPA